MYLSKHRISYDQKKIVEFSIESNLAKIIQDIASLPLAQAVFMNSMPTYTSSKGLKNELKIHMMYEQNWQVIHG